eukprot:8911020-Alexandrium_andersonii.AAC.1
MPDGRLLMAGRAGARWAGHAALTFSLSSSEFVVRRHSWSAKPCPTNNPAMQRCQLHHGFRCPRLDPRGPRSGLKN